MRVGICGLAVESNSRAPRTRLADFESFFFGEGAQLGDMLSCNPRFRAFDAALRAGGQDCTPVPLIVAAAESGGPVAPEDADVLRDRLVAHIRKAAPLDAVWVIGHGAGTIAPRQDFDGPYLSALRSAVGPTCPIVALFDYHANISDEMMVALEASVGYRTNPHTDISERAGECGAVLARILGGGRPARAWIRLPLVSPQIVQRTEVAPMAGIMADIETILSDGNVATASVYPGFALGDTADNGFSIVIESWADRDHAAALVARIADRAWAARDAFSADLVPIPEAIARTETHPGPWILADIADNPGGGGRGNTPHVMRALLEHGARDVQIVPVFDPPIAAQAHTLGEGASFTAHFNRDETTEHSELFSAEARVEKLTDGRFHHQTGMSAGMEGDYGPSALLRIDHVAVAVTSHRRQTLGPSEFRHFGLNPGVAQIIVAKSRGHFRAGFRGLIPDERIIELDAPGLVPGNLAPVRWHGLTRPIHPLDPMPGDWREVTGIKTQGKED
nr:M81 family metallopeptidase [Boseongicola sp. H5]